jgi:hypothetical protein
VLGVEWVHLPCLEQAFLRLMGHGPPGEGFRLELLCPECGEGIELEPEDAETELAEADRRLKIM